MTSLSQHDFLTQRGSLSDLGSILRFEIFNFCLTQGEVMVGR